MSLPFVLAGPILRRVEPKLVSVWIALSRPATVTITLWEGRTKGGSGELFRSNAPTTTLRIADNLHVTVALARIPTDSQKILKPEHHLQLRPHHRRRREHAHATLARAAEERPDGERRPGRERAAASRARLYRGFPAELCAAAGQAGGPAHRLRLVPPAGQRAPRRDGDDRRSRHVRRHPSGIKPLYEDALKRPHQLVLGGDQIYADDVWAGHLLMLNPLANELIGTYKDPQSRQAGRASFRSKRCPWTARTSSPTHAEDPDQQSGRLGARAVRHRIPCGLVPFPAGRRRSQILRVAQMTTTDGESHLYSFGEFAALYLTVWSNACWPAPMEWPKAKDIYAPPGPQGKITPAPEYEFPKDWDALTADDVGEKEGTTYKECADRKTPRSMRACFCSDRRSCEARQAIKIDQVTKFYEALPKVRRMLANVPTYMIMDDHDATDDWNLNPIWVERVNKTTFGRAILRNALASYTVFQDWGNDPVRYLSEDTAAAGDPKRMLDTIATMFPARANATAKPATADVPAKPVMDALDQFYGLDQLPKVRLDGSYDPVNPPIKWHWSVPGPEVPDGRPRQSHASQLRVARRAARQRLAISAQKDQIPETLPAGLDVLIVDRAAAGARRRPARRTDCADGLSRLRRGEVQRPQSRSQQGGQGRAAQWTGHTPHDRHRSRRDRSLGVRSEGARSAAQAPVRAQARGAAVRRRALLRRRTR